MAHVYFVPSVTTVIVEVIAIAALVGLAIWFFHLHKCFGRIGWIIVALVLVIVAMVIYTATLDEEIRPGEELVPAAADLPGQDKRPSPDRP